MRSSTRVEFGLYDVTARADSSPVCGALQPFCDLKADFMRETVPAQVKYGTLEDRQFLMDGSFSLFPDKPAGQFWGLWSSEMSDAQGRFAAPPVLEIHFSTAHSSSGLTLHFYAPTGDWCSKVKIQWYGGNGGLLASAYFEPDAVDYYCVQKVENYRRVRITLLATSRPCRYAKLAGLDYGAQLTLAGAALVDATLLEECDPLSAEVSINTLKLTVYNRNDAFSVLSPSSVFSLLQKKQALRVYADVRETPAARLSSQTMGTFYLSDWENTSDTLATLSATDAVGLLDGAPYEGGIYDTTAGELAADILAGYDYELDDTLAAEPVQGWLPADTRRSALQQLAFALGALVDCSRGGVIRIYPAPQQTSRMIYARRKLQGNSKVTLRPLITGVAVTAHRYTAGSDVTELYRGTLDAGVQQVSFSDPVVPGSLTASGAAMTRSGYNSCTLTVDKPGEVIVTGCKYTDYTTTLRQAAAKLPPNVQDNELTVTDATLVSPDRAAALAERILAYYAMRTEHKFRMLGGDERLGERLIVQSFAGQMVRGVLEKMEFDLTGGFLADVRVVGSALDTSAAAYTGDEIHAGERSLI